MLMQVFSRLVGENAPSAGEKSLQPYVATTKSTSEKKLGRRYHVDFITACSNMCKLMTSLLISTVKFGFASNKNGHHGHHIMCSVCLLLLRSWRCNIFRTFQLHMPDLSLDCVLVAFP